MNIRRIIREEINRVLLENEDENKSTVRKNAIKDRNGWRKDFDYAKNDKENAELNDADNEKLADRLDDEMLNIAALARKVYPDHTPEGAQSQLRKKIEHIDSDSGKPYKFRRGEARKLNNMLSKLGK